MQILRIRILFIFRPPKFRVRKTVATRVAGKQSVGRQQELRKHWFALPHLTVCPTGLESNPTRLARYYKQYTIGELILLGDGRSAAVGEAAAEGGAERCRTNRGREFK